MSMYLVQASYTTEALAALMKKPVNRTQMISRSAKNLGGKLAGIWVSFGDQDIVALVEMPDNVSAAAMSMAISAGGSLKSYKTTLLFTIDESIAALKKAAASGYVPVSAG